MAVLEISTPDPRTLDESVRPFAEAVGERYAIKRTIGRGGMGVVYLARDRRLDRHVAIKTLQPQLAGDRTLRERFVREARAAGRCRIRTSSPSTRRTRSTATSTS